VIKEGNALGEGADGGSQKGRLNQKITVELEMLTNEGDISKRRLLSLDSATECRRKGKKNTPHWKRRAIDVKEV